MKNKIKTGICVFDIHHPEHDTKLWENILKVVKEVNPDYFVFGGDTGGREAEGVAIGGRIKVLFSIFFNTPHWILLADNQPA